MLQESKDIIIKNFLTLMKTCDVQVLRDVLIKKKVFSPEEISYIFSTSDERHNKRVFFFNIQKKEESAFNKLIESLNETNQRHIAEILVPVGTGTKGIKLLCPPSYNNEVNVSPSELIPLHVNPDTTSLEIQVQLSNQFYDTTAHNKAVDFYSSRSKKRGRVLIINNYDYVDNKHDRRNGATVDNKNLNKLFTQMGGFDMNHYDNQTGEEMKIKVVQFAQDPRNNQYDICFVIIMGHGNVSEVSHETIIYGVDGNTISANDIQKNLRMKNARAFEENPKYSSSKGDYLDHTIQHTETDSVARVPIKSQPKMSTNIRTYEDMLIGYATLHGYKAHRDPYRGSWYIELICQKFMTYAHSYSVGELLQLVDQDLRKRMSEIQTMQTAEHSFKGFKNLYLNPGIYFEDGVMRYFNS